MGCGNGRKWTPPLRTLLAVLNAPAQFTQHKDEKDMSSPSGSRSPTVKGVMTVTVVGAIAVKPAAADRGSKSKHRKTQGQSHYSDSYKLIRSGFLILRGAPQVRRYSMRRGLINILMRPSYWSSQVNDGWNALQLPRVACA